MPKLIVRFDWEYGEVSVFEFDLEPLPEPNLQSWDLARVVAIGPSGSRPRSGRNRGGRFLMARTPV